MSSIPLWLGIMAFVCGGLGALGASIAILRSRYRDQTDVEREKYISALESRNVFLEEMNARQAKDQDAMKRELSELTGWVKGLQALVLMRCQFAEIDPSTGGCRFCAKGMAYGQGGS